MTLVATMAHPPGVPSVLTSNNQGDSMSIWDVHGAYVSGERFHFSCTSSKPDPFRRLLDRLRGSSDVQSCVVYVDGKLAAGECWSAER